MTALRDAAVTLSDGRRLAYTEWGRPEGRPVMAFHGTPGSRLWCPDEVATAAAGARLIIPDRPGIGASDPLDGVTLADWPRDVEALADSLGLSSFGVIGLSAGGPYAAACAALAPDRLRGVALVASRALSEYNWAERADVVDELASDDRAVFDLAQRDPAAAADLAASDIADWFGQLRDHPETVQAQLQAEADGDRWFFRDRSRRADFEAGIRAWTRQGLEGVKWAMIDTFLPWGFRIADIAIPVTIWFGSQDPRIKHLEFQARTIPHATSVVWPGVGHLGFVKHWAEILEAVM